MPSTKPVHARPPLTLALLEFSRAFGEFSFLPAAEYPLRLTPTGDGHSVVVAPGFLTSDNSTRPLRRFIRNREYYVYGWKMGRNMGPTTVGDGLERLVDLVHTIHRQSNRKVSLIGWSLGGVMLREVAKLYPDIVRQVITLGSPLHREPSVSNCGVAL